MLELNPAELRELADIKERTDAIFGVQSCEPNIRSPVVRRKKPHWSQTPEGRTKLAKVQRARWRRTRK